VSPCNVLVVGGSRHGGNSTGLARGFRELGHAVVLLGVDRYLPSIDRSPVARGLGRLLMPVLRRRFNQAIVETVEAFRPEVVVLCKGAYVLPATLARIRSRAWVANFFPDNSFLAHRGLDPEIFPHCDHIFSTKRFGVADFEAYLGRQGNVTFLPHGYDPQTHRPFSDARLLEPWACDVSFIGTWSPRKEQLLSRLRAALEPGQLRIWGYLWHRRRDRELDSCIVGHGIVGDPYALAISGSTINLGLLSERRTGAGDDDQITSRTFHIPASGGFLLHQRTAELAEYFEEGREVACFASAEELVDKVKYYLAHEAERRRIARAGYERCIAGNRLSRRAQVILDTYRAGRAAAPRTPSG
jgi:glycosyltransferase involved in cell wall biosynthesis